MLKYLARYKRKQFPVYAPDLHTAREKAIAHLNLPEDKQDELDIALGERYALSRKKETA